MLIVSKIIKIIKKRGIQYFIYLLIDRLSDFFLRNSFFLKYKFYRVLIINLFFFNSTVRDISYLKKNLSNYRLKKRNLCILDIGTNLGVISTFFHDNFNCNIYAYEPNPYCYNYLKKNLKKYKNIIIYKKAISKKNDNLKFYLGKDFNSNKKTSASSLDPNKENIDTNNYIVVETYSIYNLINKHKFIDILKIDIEGEEYKIIIPILKNIHKIGVVICEFHRKSEYQKINYNRILKIINENDKFKSKFVQWV